MTYIDFDDSFLDENKSTKLEPTTAEKYFPSIYKLFDEDKVPNFIKEGYNRSIEGLAYQSMTGKKFYNVGEYTPNHLEDIGATIVSFVATPTDLASMALGGAVGKAVLKPLMSKAAGFMLKGGVPKNLAKKAVENGTKAVINKGAQKGLADETASLLAREATATNLAGAVGSLGFYSGLQSAALQKVEQNDVDALKVLYDATKGGLTAFAAQTAALGLSPTILSKLGTKSRFAEQAAVKGIEVGVFGTSGAAFETLEGRPRLPHLSEYTHAIGVVGGLTLARKAITAPRQIRESRRLDKVTEKDIQQTARELLDIKKLQQVQQPKDFRGRKKADTNEILLGDKMRIYMFDSNWRGKANNNKIKIFVDAPGNTKLSKGEQVLPKKVFNKKIQGQVKDSYEKTFDKDISSSMRKYESNLNKKRILDADKIRKDLGQSKEEFSLTKNNYRKNGDLGNFTSKQILKHYQLEKSIKDFVNTQGKTETFRRAVASYKYPSAIEKLLSPKAYENLIKLKPGLDLIRHPFRLNTEKQILKYIPEQQRLRNSYLSPLKQDGKYVSVAGKSGIFELGTKKDNPEAFLASRVMRENVVGLDGKVYEGGKGLKPGIKFKFTEKETNKAVGDVFELKNFNPDALRKGLDGSFKLHEAAGVKTAEKLNNYLPNMFSKKALDVLQGNITKIAKELDKNPLEFRDFMKVKNKKSTDQDNMRVQNLITEYLNAPKTDPMFKDAMNILTKIAEKNQNIKNPQINAFQRLTDIFFTERLGNRNPFVEKSRKFDVPEELMNLKGFMENDIRHITQVYFNKASERVASARNFGPKEEFITGAITGLSKIGRESDAKALIKIHKALTGKIEYDPKYNWDINTKNLLADLTNIHVATKIGLGFSVIPNLTQTFISTALKTGYGPIFNGWYKYKTQPEYRKLVDSMGFEYSELLKSTFAVESSGTNFTNKFARYTTDRFLGIPGLKKISFNNINDFNFKTSQIGAIEYLLKQQKILNNQGIEGLRGKAFQSYRLKANQELSKAGITKDTNLNLSKAKGKKLMSVDTFKKLQDYSFNFAKDYQLQRNVLRDPLFMSDPRFRPFALFKRFGYRQFTLLQRILSEEAKTNPEVILRLGMAGVAGTAIIQPATEMLSDLLTGEDVFSEDYNVSQLVSVSNKEGFSQALQQIKLTDVINSLSTVGAAGMVGDILAAEAPTDLMRNLKFQITPVMFDSMNDGYNAFYNLAKDIPDFGIAGALRRTPKSVAPLLGAGPSRLLKRLETERQKEGRINSIRTRTIGNILDSLIEKDVPTARRLITEFNNSYGSINPITFDNVSYDKISKRYLRKQLKRKYPNINIDINDI